MVTESSPALDRIRVRTARSLYAVLALFAGALSSCSPRTGLESLVLGDRVERRADIRYASGDRRTLDVYREARALGRSPVVIFLYGGRWKHGSKDDYLLIGNSFARQGWITVIPDYRLYPDALFPAWVEDAASVVRWTVENVPQLGGDPRNVFVVGHSAGAHSAALLALDESYLEQAGVARHAVRGFVSVAGPVDTNWTAPDVQRLMGPPSGWPRTYPATHVGGSAPPLLLMHGAADDVVFPVGSTRLARRITEVGGCARARIYPNLGHIDIAVALGLPALRAAPVLEDLRRFLRDPSGVTCPKAMRTTP